VSLSLRPEVSILLRMEVFFAPPTTGRQPAS